MFHVKQLRKLLAIAGNTARELVRNPAYVMLVAFGSALAALSPAFAFFHLGEQLKMVVDLGLGTALVVGLLVGVLGASWAVNEELESLSALAILAKPVSRTVFLLGKYLGVLAAAALAVALQGAALLFTLRVLGDDSSVFLACALAALVLAGAGAVLLVRLGTSRGRAAMAAFGLAASALIVALDSHGLLALFGREIPGWSWALVPGLIGVILQVAVLGAVAVALATRLTLAVNLPVVLAVFVLGQLAGDMVSVNEREARRLAQFLGREPGVSVERSFKGSSFAVRLGDGEGTARGKLERLLGAAAARSRVTLSRVRHERAGGPATGTEPGERAAGGERYTITVERPAWSLVGYLMPDLVAFQFSDAVAEHISAGAGTEPGRAQDEAAAVPGRVLAGAVLVSMIYAGGALLVGSALFARRDLQ